ncbi:MAG: hypothetical protein LBT20_04230, partial [Clostridiales bacterium]|nr:hypothetical protein [Clostridiales bacterium]
IDIAGASVSIIRLDGELKSLLDFTVNTPALKWGASEDASVYIDAVKAIGKALAAAGVAVGGIDSPKNVKKTVAATEK